MDDYEEVDNVEQPKQIKKGNVLPMWGNERTMNMNQLILTNIQSSHYFKVNLYELKTYHEVIDEIFYKVSHLEPWEKGSRKTAGQTGMCGGVRGVGAGGIVSTAYCLLYKLFTLRLTRKQLNGLINHPDSPYLRALGFMYIRYTQPPADLFDWYSDYMEDGEELDVKAGGGQVMTIGVMVRAFLTKLEWFSTLFPRIPVPIQQKIEKQLNEKFPPAPRQPIQQLGQQRSSAPHAAQRDSRNPAEIDNDKYARGGNRGNDRWNDRGGGGQRDRDKDRERSPLRDRERERERDRDRDRDRERPRDSSRKNRSTAHRDSHRDHRDRASNRDRVRGHDSNHRHRDHRERDRPKHTR